MPCFCGCARIDHFMDGRCMNHPRCAQYESAGGIPEERMGTRPVEEPRPVVVVRRERGAWSSAPRDDE